MQAEAVLFRVSFPAHKMQLQHWHDLGRPLLND